MDYCSNYFTYYTDVYIKPIAHIFKELFGGLIINDYSNPYPTEYALLTLRVYFTYIYCVFQKLKWNFEIYEHTITYQTFFSVMDVHRESRIYYYYFII